jgi:DNA-binding NarL/FixJ family response regulator
MRAVLLSENSSLTARFEAVFVLTEIDLTVTATVHEMLVAAAKGGDVAFLVVDCSLDAPGDLERCRHIVRQTTLPVHIVHPHPAALDELRSLANGELVWVPPEEVGLPFLPKALDLAGGKGAVAAVEGILREQPIPRRVYAVGPEGVGTRRLVWEGLLVMVRRVPGIELLSAATEPDEAIAHVTEVRPDGILLGTDDEGTAVLELVRGLRHASPESRLVVFGEQPNEEMETQLQRLDAWTYVLWEDLSQEAVTCTLATVLIAGLQVVSRRALEAIVQEPEGRRHARHGDLAFTSEERALLRGIANGVTQAAVAEQEGLSVRTVRRKYRELRLRLGVESRSELATLARELGFGEEVS